MSDSENGIDIEYGLDERPPWANAVLLGLQHVAVMIVPATAVAYIVAGAVGLSAANTAYVVQMVLLFSGIATVVQAYTVGVVGARLPIVMGTSFTLSARRRLSGARRDWRPSSGPSSRPDGASRASSAGSSSASSPSSRRS